MQIRFTDILAARARLAGTALGTPMVPSTALQARLGHPVWHKLELCQPTGAFKLRGAMNAISRLGPDAQGVTCASTGNHGRAVAWAAKARGLRAVVCLSSLVPRAKVEGIRALGAEIRTIGRSQDDAQAEVDRLVAEEGLAEIPPFDHPDIIAGQGTIGLEMLEAVPDLTTLLVPLSGGGLAAGVALAAKTLAPDIRVIGISMDRGAAMDESLRAGHPVPVEEVASLADSLGGGIGATNRHSFALCRDLLDEVVLLTEDEIYRGIQSAFHDERLVAEGGAAVGIAALLAGKVALDGPAATILTGRNADMDQIARIVAGQSVTVGDRSIDGGPYEP
ncbi:hydroxyectoine utilization dehydratase EutB [Litorisediminicola beolgyonensis]|uniref:Hydroxyectoine utilization dehydratase EutB n=1 Tax=Litorisediminicola beolgyonensis TaxID=1173614 RepID=A0ABW3ZK58_9RHOB